MRVALDLSAACGAWTGVGRYVRDLASGLAAAGEPSLGVYQGHRGALPAEVAAACAAVARYDLFTGRIGLALRLPRVLRGCDVWHATTTIGAPGPGWRGAIVATVHDCWPLDPRCAITSRGRKRFARLLDALLARAALVLCPSRSTADEVRARGWRGELRIVPHGVAPPPPAPPRPLAGPYLLTLGAIEARKRYDLLAGALATMRERPAWHHVGPVRDDPDGAIAAAMDAAGCTRHGWVDEATREAWLANALVVAQPSVTEGFGYVPVEAMARGVPVLCAWAGAPVEWLADAALWVVDATADAWAGALRSLIRDHELRARLASAGRARAARFTIAAMVAAHRAAYGDALAIAGRGRGG